MAGRTWRRRTLFTLAALAAGAAAPRWVAGAEEPERPLEPQRPLETVETRSGKRYRGQVLGYDQETKSYLLLAEGSRLTVPETEILTIHPAEAPLAEARPADAHPSGTPPVRVEARVREAVEGPEAPPPAPRAEGVGGEGSLESVLTACRSLPPPRTPEALQALEEALEKVRSGTPLAGAEPLRRALRAEPGTAAPLLLLAAIHLEVAREPEAAYALLVTLPPERRSPHALALLERAAGLLGYRRLRDRLAVEGIERRYEGAEESWRLFRLFQGRDPARAQAAFREYRRLDPRWEVVESREGQTLREAREALERNEFTRAAGLLTAALQENPFLEDEARPLLAGALRGRAERARATGLLEVALGDLTALLEEAPEERHENQRRLEEVERELVEARLGRAESAREAAEAARSLNELVPGLKERHGESMVSALARAARRALEGGGFEEALEAARVSLDVAGAVNPEVVLALAEALARQAPAAAEEQVRLHLGILEELGAREGPAAATLEEVRRMLAEGGSRGVRGAPASAASLSAPAEAPAAGSLSPRVREVPRAAAAAGQRHLLYLPLIEGTRWNYLHGDGTREVQRLERAERLPDGRIAYRFAVDYQLAEARVPYFKTGFFDGDLFQVAAGSRVANGEPMFKLPVAVGERWSWRKGDIVFEREYAAIDARVACRAGTFENCLKVKASSRFDGAGARSRPVVQWFYYAPAVGLVKIEGENAFDGRELEEYRIPGATGTAAGEGGLGGAPPDER